jgi:hypothetical protein
MKMEQTECSETLAYKIQTPGNYPEENIQHTEHGGSLKSRVGRLKLRWEDGVEEDMRENIRGQELEEGRP